MSQSSDSENNSSYQQELPMRGHGFLIYFSLWAGAVSVVFSAFRLFTGMDYTQGGLSLDYVYGMYPSLRTVSVVFGAIFLGMAAFTIYTRFQLAGLKSGAPGKLTVVYILNIVLTLLYAMALAGALGIGVTELLDGSIVGQFIGSAAMAIVNGIYYSKRSHLFVN